MSSPVLGFVCMLGGAGSLAVGLLVVTRRLRRIARVHHKRGLVHAAMPEGWGTWFFQGFSDVTMGTRWAVTILLLVFWIGLGVSLFSLGIRLTS